MSTRISSTEGSSPAGRRGLSVGYLTNRLPFPPHSGGQAREAQTLERLGGLTEIHFVAVTDQFDVDSANIEHARPFCASATLVEADAVAEERRRDVPERVLRYRSAAMSRTVARLLATTPLEMVHVEGYFLMQHVPADARVPVLLVEENIEYDLDRLRQLTNPGLTPSWQVTRALEHAAWRRAAVLGGVTERDVERIRRDVPNVPVVCLYPGSDHLEAEIEPFLEDTYRRRHTACVLFVGNMTWPPSEDAAAYLARDVWPLVKAAVPNGRLVIVGAGVSRRLERLAEERESVELAGEVESLAPYLLAADVAVCPLRFGGGIKIKILESLRAGRATVSTPIGMQGLPACALEAIVVASETEELAARIVELLTSPDRRVELGRRARACALQLPTWSECAERLHAAWLETAQAAAAPGMIRAPAGS
jgi:polysaccharide biosynthesis protein PslH